MAEHRKIKAEETIDFEEFLEKLDDLGEDLLQNPDKREKSTNLLARLTNNRKFLTRFFLNFLSDPSLDDGNEYTSQVFILAARSHYVIRATIWLPSPTELNADVLSYGFAHDHNFNLLTINYAGKGYSTDIYHYDPKGVSPEGIYGEAVQLSFEDTYTVTQGESLYMERNKDVHVQHPPAGLSIYLNVMASDTTDQQYAFDVEKNEIRRTLLVDAGSDFINAIGWFANSSCLDAYDEFIESESKLIEKKRLEELASKTRKEIAAIEC